MDASRSTAERVRTLLAVMTPEEKIAQIGKLRAWTNYERQGSNLVFRTGYEKEYSAHPVGSIYGLHRCDNWCKRGWESGVTPEISCKARNAFQRVAVEKTRLGIPIFFVEEAPHGLMALGATSFPTGLGLGSSFDKDLLFRVGEFVGRDCVRRGIASPYAPILDIARDPRWRRVEECFGEDPQLVTLLGEAQTRGFLKAGVQPCLKHFVGGGASEGGHNRYPVHMGGRELFSQQLRPFRSAILAGARHLMSTYHDVDGERCTNSKWLLEDVLRGQLGFDGFVTADGGAIGRAHWLRQDESLARVYAKTLRNGTDGDCGGTTPADCSDGFRRAYAEGLLLDEDLDKAVGRILSVKFDMGLFEHPYVDESAEVDCHPQSVELALEAARKSLVLLKNDGLLPLGSPRRIALLGPNAALRPGNQLGDYTAPQRREDVTMVVDGLARQFPAAEILYAKGCGVRSRDKSGFDEAVAKAARADVSVLVLGGSSNTYGDVRRDPKTGATLVESVTDENDDKESGEGTDRATLCLSGVQMDLFRVIRARAKRLVVVLIQGRPLELDEIMEKADAVLMAWYPGCRGGEAVAEVLAGKVNPSGRLPVSIPRSAGQLPVAADRQQESPAHYVDSPGDALLPFGYGLSYARFSYANLSVERKDAGYAVSVDVHNDGVCSAEHSVLFAFTRLSSDMQRPWRELGDFVRVSLLPGEIKRAVGFITDEVIGSYDRNGVFESPEGRIRFSLIGDGGQPGQVELSCFTTCPEVGMKRTGSASDRVTWENLGRFAASNVDLVKGPVVGIVIEEHGLGCQMFEPDKARTYGAEWAERGVVLVHPHTDPWSWMNDQAIAMTDEIVDVIMSHYQLPADVKILVSGGSMGGQCALVWARYTKHKVAACTVNCPVCDLEYHATERPDVIRTVKAAFGGDADFDAAVRKHSPLRLVKELPDIPYLFVHADEDKAVNKGAHSDRLVSALRAAGRKVDYVISRGKGHCRMTDEAREIWDNVQRAVFANDKR